MALTKKTGRQTRSTALQNISNHTKGSDMRNPPRQASTGRHQNKRAPSKTSAEAAKAKAMRKLTRSKKPAPILAAATIAAISELYQHLEALCDIAGGLCLRGEVGKQIGGGIFDEIDSMSSVLMRISRRARKAVKAEAA